MCRRTRTALNAVDSHHPGHHWYPAHVAAQCLDWSCRSRPQSGAGRRGAARHPREREGTGRLEQVARLVARHPQTQVVIDHLGLPQPFEPPAPEEPFADLPKLLALAAYPNVAVKISGACTLSHAPFPFPDLWDPLARIFDAFGLQ